MSEDKTPEPTTEELVAAAESLVQSLMEGQGSADDTPISTVPDVLQVLPLRESVIYPMLIAPLSVSREPSIEAIDQSITESDRVIGVLTQRNPMMDNPGFEDLYDIGCAVIIRTMVKMGEATRLIVQGLSRFRVVEQLQTEPTLKVRIETIPEPTIPEGKEEEVEALRRSIAAMFDQAVRLSPNLPDDLRNLTQAVEEPNVMADLVAAHLPLPTEDKQRLLEVIPLLERQKTLLAMLSKEVRVLELTSKVQSEVSNELTKNQREFYLREQLKAIQRELGEDIDHGDELEEIRQRIESVGLSAEALREVKREYDRLRRINPGSPEYTVARTYVDTILALPWSKSSTDEIDLKQVQQVLDDEHYGLQQVKDRIVEFLAVRKVKTDGRIRQPILCLSGPPGVGKTSLGRSIATAMNREFVRASLGGMRDEAEIRGHRRTYIGALPGQILQGLRRVGVNNPVFVLDEIDKLANDFRGDPASALLEVLDPEQNHAFRDHYLDVPFDLSRVLFIATANRLDTIPPALRDRMEIIEIGGYTEQEKFEIAKRHLAPKQIEEHGLTRGKFAFTDPGLIELIRHYTREAGVRNLEREIGRVVRKATRLFAEGRKTKVTATPKVVQEALGARTFLHDEVSERKLKPGMSIGLAWTPVGGDILFIEAVRMAGKGLTVTGQLGDVMRESVSAALSYIRSHSSDLGVPDEVFEKSELHVHVPAGAVPKDGPSAGVAMLVALTSLLTGKTCRERTAMTGEITLTGQVLPVGGIKEKCLAAHRAGVTTVLLPEENKKDYLQDVPEPVRAELKAIFVRSAQEALKATLNL